MKKQYYSYRKNGTAITFTELIEKYKTVYSLLQNRDYFKQLAGISHANVPDEFQSEASLILPFQPFPIEKWKASEITEDNIFDTIEFMFDYVSKPYGWEDKTTGTGWDYFYYEGYEKETGQNEYREYVNMFLNDYKEGYDLNSSGEIVIIGKAGLDILLSADVIEYDLENIDKHVKWAIQQWKKRNLTLEERKAVIIEFANVFEWLKKVKKLENVLDKGDDKLIFDMVNNFEIRHHNPRQFGNYDKSIWYSWMFHFYLATYHAIVRLLIKEKNG